MDDKGNKTYFYIENQRNSVTYFLTSFLATLVFGFKRQLNKKEEKKKKRGEREKKRRRRKRLDWDPAHPPSLNKQTRILTRRPDSGPPFSARPRRTPLKAPSGVPDSPRIPRGPGVFRFWRTASAAAAWTTSAPPLCPPSSPEMPRARNINNNNRNTSRNSANKGSSSNSSSKTAASASAAAAASKAKKEEEKAAKEEENAKQQVSFAVQNGVY